MKYRYTFDISAKISDFNTETKSIEKAINKETKKLGIEEKLSFVASIATMEVESNIKLKKKDIDFITKSIEKEYKKQKFVVSVRLVQTKEV